MMSLLIKIERHLRRCGVSPSRFGRDVVGDPRFVFDLRRGREPRAEMQARVLNFIMINDATATSSRSLSNNASSANRVQGAA